MDNSMDTGYCHSKRNKSIREEAWLSRKADTKIDSIPLKDPNYHCTYIRHFLIAKENKLKLGQVGVGSNIAQNH